MNKGVCREGHVSDEPDYCSVCGVAMTAGAAPPPLPAGARAPSMSTPLPNSVKRALPGACPECGEPREGPDARFCEVCRFDFVAGRPGPPPAGASKPQAPAASTASATVPAASTPSAVSKAAVATATAMFELVVTVDPSLDTEPDPESPCPAGGAAQTLAVDRADVLVGRRDERRDIHPELPLNDPGTSRRHCKFVQGPDGALALLDLASTNGTKVNGVEVPAGSRTPLRAGDEVTLGRWTRIVVKARP